VSKDSTKKRLGYSGTLKVGGPTLPDAQPVKSQVSGAVGAVSRSKAFRGEEDFRRLSRDILKLGEIKSCIIIDQHGTVLAQMLGDLPEDRYLITKGGGIAAVIWGGLKNFEPFAGQLGFVSAVFENCKFVGIPFPEARIAVILVVGVQADSFRLKDTVSDYVRNWFERA
jgi:hypothetical protein